MSDPYAVLPFDSNGNLRDGIIIGRIALYQRDAAIKLGWVPLTEATGTNHEYAILMWIDCACGREIKLPL